jgi:hypothetical protein
MNIGAKLIELLDPFDIEQDSYKNAQGQGIVERFNLALGADMDAELLPKLDALVETLLDPRTAAEPYLTLLENMLGDIPRVSTDLALRRKLVQYSTRLYNLKGTKRSYELMFKLLGFTSVTITEFSPSGGFDSDLTLDDPERTFDSGNNCATCSGYDLYLTGTLVMAENALLSYVAVAIRFCEPINAKLRSAYYNQDPIKLPTIRLYQSETGDAMVDYGTGAAPGFGLSATGDLLVKGEGSENTKMDNDGNVTEVK